MWDPCMQVRILCERGMSAGADNTLAGQAEEAKQRQQREKRGWYGVGLHVTTTGTPLPRVTTLTQTVAGTETGADSGTGRCWYSACSCGWPRWQVRTS